MSARSLSLSLYVCVECVTALKVTVKARETAALLGAFPDCAVAAPPTVKNDLVVQSRVLLLPPSSLCFRTFAGRSARLSKATSMRAGAGSEEGRGTPAL